MGAIYSMIYAQQLYAVSMYYSQLNNDGCNLLSFSLSQMNLASCMDVILTSLDRITVGEKISEYQ